MTDSVRESLNDLIAYDDARASAPFEHGFVAVAGLGLLVCAVAAPSRGRAVFHAAIAGALLCRAASGKDGLRKWVESAQPENESKWVIARP